MIKNKNIIITSTIVIVILIAIVAFTFIELKPSVNKGSEPFARKFVETFVNPQNSEITEHYNSMLNPSIKTKDEIEENFVNYVNSVKNEYAGLMTKRGFDNAVSSRLLPWDVMIEENDNYDVKLKSITLDQKDVYEDSKVHYTYQISLEIIYPKDRDKLMSVSGDIVMIEENEVWLVDIFKWNSDYQELYKSLSK